MTRSLIHIKPVWNPGSLIHIKWVYFVTIRELQSGPAMLISNSWRRSL